MRWSDGASLTADCVGLTEVRPAPRVLALEVALDEAALRSCLLRALDASLRAGGAPGVSVSVQAAPDVPFGDLLRATMASRAGTDGAEPFEYADFDARE